jgi:hypothetical protein
MMIIMTAAMAATATAAVAAGVRHVLEAALSRHVLMR